jgi:hypothetical protein
MGIFAMSYIWEQPNKGNTLYEMALNKQRSLMEAKANHFYTLTDEGKANKADITAAGGTLTDSDTRACFVWDDADPASKDTVNKVKALLGKKYLVAPGAGGAGGASGPAGRPFKVVDTEQKARVEKVLTDNGAKFAFKDNPDGSVIVTVANADDDKVGTCLKELMKNNFLADAREQSEIDTEVHNKREATLAKIIEQFPEDVRLKVALACYNLAANKWVDGTVLEPGSKNEKTAETFLKAVTEGNEEQARTALSSIETAISDGRIKVDPSNSGLYSIANIEKQVTGNIRMPAMFDAEIDDSMWNEIVINDFGIPLVNLSNEAVKKVISSDDPEHECPGDLKLVKQKLYGDKRLKLVFGEGGFERMLEKAFNFLTLGVAAATTDAGKRADRIIKELKEKGGMTTHRNLLLVKYDDIVDADPENPDIRITAKAYNRSNKKFVGEVDVPVAMLGQFYSAVDPVKSAKMYIEMYNNDDCGDYGMSELTAKKDMDKGKKLATSIEASSTMHEEPLFEYCGANRAATPQKPLYEYILCTALAVAAAAAVPQVKNLITGVKGSGRANGVNNAEAGSDASGKEFAGLKKQYVEMLDKEGHPPSYVLKPKSANKEVVIISKASTGHMHGGKVYMVTLKIGDHQAAAFMSPAECKKYFSV